MEFVKFELTVSGELDKILIAEDLDTDNVYNLLVDLPRECIQNCAFDIPDEAPVLDLHKLEAFLEDLENTVNDHLKTVSNTRAVLLCFCLSDGKIPVLSFFLHSLASACMIPSCRVICNSTNDAVYH